MAYAITEFLIGTGSGSGVTTWDAPAFTSVAGQTLVAYVRWESGPTNIASLTDIGEGGPNNSPWTLRVTQDLSVRRWRVYTLNQTGAGASQIRATWSSNVNFPLVAIVAISGLTVAPFDTSSVNAQGIPTTAVDAVTSNATPALAAQPACLLGFSWNYVTANNVPNSGTGFNNIGTDTARFRAEDRRLTATDGMPATFTALNGGDGHATIALVFTEAGASPGRKGLTLLGCG